MLLALLYAAAVCALLALLTSVIRRRRPALTDYPMPRRVIPGPGHPDYPPLNRAERRAHARALRRDC